jgi:hypothetical protein
MAEQLVALCPNCKCCLASSTHCWVCHTEKSIADLCGDAVCEQRVEDYKQRVMVMEARRLARLTQK